MHAKAFASWVCAVLLLLSLVWTGSARAQDCNGTNTDVCDPGGLDLCWPAGGGLWDCFTARAGANQSADVVTIYDATSAGYSGTADTYTTFGTDSLGNDFCCFYPAANISDIFLHGSDYDDTLAFQYGLGDDLQEGSLGALAAVASGGPGDDTIDGSRWAGVNYAEALTGNDGEDVISGYDGIEEISGGIDDDICDGMGGADLIYGDADDDTLAGGFGADTIFGDGESDTINGDFDDDDIYGGAQPDYVSGDDDEDELYGGDGTDVLCGDAASGNYLDELFGEAANDVMWGDDTMDVGDGGAGSDTCDDQGSYLSCTATSLSRPGLCP